jgi:hypothetical protein
MGIDNCTQNHKGKPESNATNCLFKKLTQFKKEEKLIGRYKMHRKKLEVIGDTSSRYSEIDLIGGGSVNSNKDCVITEV